MLSIRSPPLRHAHICAPRPSHTVFTRPLCSAPPLQRATSHRLVSLRVVVPVRCQARPMNVVLPYSKRTSVREWPVHIQPPRRWLATSPSATTVMQLLPSRASLQRWSAWVIILIAAIVLILQLAPAEVTDAIFSRSMPLVLANLERFGFQELLLRFLIRALRDSTLRDEFVQEGGIERVLSLPRGDASVNALVAQIIANVAEDSKTVERLLSAGLFDVMRMVHGALATYDSPFADRVRTQTNAALANVILILGKRKEHFVEMLQQVGLEAMGSVLEDTAAPLEATRVVLASMATLIQTPGWTSRILSSDGMRFLHSLFERRNDGEVQRLVLRCVANLAMDLAVTSVRLINTHAGESAFRVAKEHGMAMVLSQAEVGVNGPAARQVARALAHFARDEQLQSEIAESRGMTFLLACAQQGQGDCVVHALAALSNVARCEEGTSALMRTLNLRDLSTHLSPSESVSPAEAAPHIARMFANIATHPKYVRQLWDEGGAEVLLRLAPISQQLQPSMARLLGAFAQNEDTAMELLKSPWGWPLVQSLLKSNEVSTRRQVVRALGNMAVSASDELIRQPDLQQTLRQCTKDPDARVRADAIRATASVASVGVKGPKFAEGVHLLHPEPTASGRSHDFDIVFIHGVGGDPHSTWRGGESACWPRDWLPKQFPRARVITVGYNIFLSRWSGDTLPLVEQSKEVQQKLKLAGVGSRPVVFVTHSFGGLLLKQILRNAEQDSTFRPLITNTRGIVFYAVPHLGSELTMYADYRVAQVVFRGSSALADMRPASDELKELHKEFNRFGSHISTLSFGENDRTCYGTESAITCWQVVSDESANPGYEGPMRHDWVKLDHNHREVCKPKDESDPRYKHVADFIAETVTSMQLQKKSK